MILVTGATGVSDDRSSTNSECSDQNLRCRDTTRATGFDLGRTVEIGGKKAGVEFVRRPV